MKAETFHLEVITPCFCSGAEPEKHAEIRAASIRGQLRWWFRTLGGFKSLAASGMGVRQQEDLIFGTVASGVGAAAKLAVRAKPVSVRHAVKDGQELGHRNFSDPAYLTFPIQTREKKGQRVGYSGRGVLLGGEFDLSVFWRGRPECWVDIKALVGVYGHLGALGFRGRRAMGALAFSGKPPGMGLSDDLSRFSRPHGIRIQTLGVCGSDQTVPKLGGWLKRWRAYGRTGNNDAERTFPGYPYAQADHNSGAAVFSRTPTDGPTFRPSLGLPIVQYFSSNNQTVNWEWDWDPVRRKPVGRFASPVLLRPHRDAQGQWHALVIFVDAHQWPNDPATGRPKQVFLNGQPRAVSRDLYEAMKNDKALKPFP